jgi:hypothetical protein
MVHATLFPTLNVLQVTLALPKVTSAVPGMAAFCSSLISCFPGMLLRYFQNDLKMVPVALNIILL